MGELEQLFLVVGAVRIPNVERVVPFEEEALARELGAVHHQAGRSIAVSGWLSHQNMWVSAPNGTFAAVPGPGSGAGRRTAWWPRRRRLSSPAFRSAERTPPASKTSSVIR